MAQNKAFHFKGFTGLFLKTITCIVWSNNQKKGPLGFFSIASGYLVSCFEFLKFTLINMVGTVMGCLIPLRGEENEDNLFKLRN